MKERILVLGATSEIATKTAELFAHEGSEMFLVARNEQRLSTVNEHLQALGAARVESACLDLQYCEGHEDLVNKAFSAFDGIDVALIAYGTLPDAERCLQDAAYSVGHFHTNATSIISLALRLARRFQVQRSGTIAVISSVAGDRGRAGNFVYGSAKGALDLFLEGLRARLHGTGVNVVTIKPGFVDTPMTRNLQRNFLFAESRAVGRGIYQAIRSKKEVVYLPWFWRWIMLVVRLMPGWLLRRLSI